MSEPISIPLRNLNRASWSPTRRAEPVTFGIPLPKGAVTREGTLVLDGPAGPTPAFIRPIDFWSDGSIRWSLIDAAIDAAGGEAAGYAVRLTAGAAPSIPTDLQVTNSGADVEVTTHRARFSFRAGGAFPCSAVVTNGDALLAEPSGLEVVHDGRAIRWQIADVHVRERGPIRADLEITAKPTAPAPIEVFARVEIFAGTSTMRVAVTIRNSRRAQHAGGQWPLGDPGSIFLTSCILKIAMTGAIDRLRCAVERGQPLAEMAPSFEIHQESSGGDRWDGPIHRNREGRVALRYRGYRVRNGERQTEGLRATPIVEVSSGRRQIAVTVPQFWENFPQAISADGASLDIKFLPASSDVHELQGGEQKTHVAVMAFGGDTVSDPPLAWVHDPLLIYPGPEWCCNTGTVPLLVPANVGVHDGYQRIVDGAFDATRGFLAKRESADEYGWRNFGDLHADHESAFQPPGQSVVSHYNNQYDAVAAFFIHFLRTGDARWWRLADDLARHVVDIDIYRTTADKSAYNGGLFWHTNHYTDAATSSHRTYPKGGKEGGGPSAEHNYNLGLMLHYFMTGSRQSRDAAIGLARWVIDMDDGRLTPFRWVAGGATGLASATGTMTYHGPGRGAANSVLACLVALRLTGDAVYLAKVEELIRRCVHPEQDLEALTLLDVERRWYYTVFLQALGFYLTVKEERGEIDASFAYARASLLHYARWMADHERPYLSQPDALEFPNETWPSQDIRKAEVFEWAAIHASGADRQRFQERARFFFEYSTSTLLESPGRFYTRPLILLLTNGVRYAWLTAKAGALPDPIQAPVLSFPAPASFEPQKVRAMRRLKLLIVAGAVLTVGLAALVALR